MPTTTPDNIWFTDDTSPSSLDTVTATLASSVQTALNDRSWRNYTWADTGERTAQTGMTNGSLGRQLDDGTLWQYDGTNWVRLFVDSNSYETLTALNTVTGYNGQKATVWGDPNPANNGDYGWSGVAWQRPYPRIATGRVNLAATNGGSVTPVNWSNNMTVTLPVGMFTETPRILATNASASGRVDTGIQVLAASASSFIARVNRISAGWDNSVIFDWLAIQETP